MASRNAWQTLRTVTLRIVLGTWAALTLSFGAIHVLIRPRSLCPPGYCVGPSAEHPSEGFLRLANDLGIDPTVPLVDQYVAYVLSGFQGDLGYSTFREGPVGAQLADALPWTALLLVLGTLLAATTIVAWTRFQTWLAARYGPGRGRHAPGLAALVPWYVPAVVAIVVFGYFLELLPVQGHIAKTVDVWSVAGVRSVLAHAILPASVLAVGIVGYLAVGVGMQVDDALQRTDTRRARVRGLSRTAIRRRYVHIRLADAWRWNGLTVTAWVLGYSIVLEELFSYPGLGYHLFQAVRSNDFALLLGSVVGLIFLGLLAHAVVDLARSRYGLADGPHLARSVAHSPEHAGSPRGAYRFVAR